jgi:hypothetical protein
MALFVLTNISVSHIFLSFFFLKLVHQFGDWIAQRYGRPVSVLPVPDQFPSL